jgi:hypothetical protein
MGTPSIACSIQAKPVNVAAPVGRPFKLRSELWPAVTCVGLFLGRNQLDAESIDPLLPVARTSARRHAPARRHECVTVRAA